MELELFNQLPGALEHPPSRTIQVPEGTGVLDETPWLAEALETAEAALKYWKNRVDELKAAVRIVAGENEEITLNGKPAFTYHYINGFRGEDFRKDHPDLYEAYLHEVKKMELDTTTLRSARPEVYREYQTRQLRRA
jgi:hypothetical protein